MARRVLVFLLLLHLVGCGNDAAADPPEAPPAIELDTVEEAAPVVELDPPLPEGDGYSTAMPDGERHVWVAHASVASIDGALPRERVDHTLRRHLNELRFCYLRAAPRVPDLVGQVRLALPIDPGGVVEHARVVSTTLHDPPVEQCSILATERWAFPTADAPTNVEVVVTFEQEER